MEQKLAYAAVMAIWNAADKARLDPNVRGNTTAMEWDVLNSIISLSKTLCDSMEV